MSEEIITQLINRLEKVTARLESLEKQVGQSGSGAAVSAGPSSAWVAEYEDLINQYIKPLVDLSPKIDGIVSEQSKLVHEITQAQLAFLKIVSESKKPSQEVFDSLLQPTKDLIGKIQTLSDKNRASKFMNNLFAISEGIGAFGWVCVSPTPAPYINDFKDGAQFYANRILKDFKGKDQNQVDWIGNWSNFLKDLQAFVKKNHTTGLSWNPKGGDASATSSAPSAPSSAPPPPPADFLKEFSVGSSTPAPVDSKPDMSALFGAINKGTDISSGLKKVTSDMKTKNQTNKSSVVPAEIPKKSTTPAATPKDTPTKPPKFALEGIKWVVENQVNNKSIVIDKTESKHTVYIYGCKGSVIQVKGKVNAISVDNCDKTAIVFENAISSFEVVNSRSIEVQVQGKVPSVAIDKTSGFQLYLSKDALDVEIVSSKSSEMNVSFPVSEEEMVETPIPEQFKTIIKDKKLITNHTSHV